MRKLLIITVVLTAISSWAQSCNGNTYTNSLLITANHAKVPNTDQTGFLFVLPFNGGARSSFALKALRTVTNGGQISNLATPTGGISSPADFCVADSSGGTVRPFFFSAYDPVSGMSEIWIAKTLTTAVDTTFTIFWGAAGVSATQQDISGACSAAGLSSFYTFGNGKTVAVNDWCGGKTLTNSNAVASPGVSGGGIWVTGSSSMTIATPWTTNTTNVTFSVWSMSSGLNTLGTIWENGAANGRYGLERGTAGCASSFVYGIILGGLTCNTLTSSPAITQGKWEHVTVRRASTTWNMLVNGSAVGGSSTSNPNAISGGSIIGVSGSYLLDNFMIWASTAISTDWDNTLVNNQGDPLSFFTISGTDTSPHLVQHNECTFWRGTGGVTGTTSTCAFPHNVTSGNLGTFYQGSSLMNSPDTCGTETISDTLTSTYSSVQTATKSPYTACLWRTTFGSSGANTLQTTFTNNNNNTVISIAEFSGLTSNAVSASATDTSTGSGAGTFTMSSLSMPSGAALVCGAAGVEQVTTFSPVNGLETGNLSAGSLTNDIGQIVGIVPAAATQACAFTGTLTGTEAGVSSVFGTATVVNKTRSAQVY